MNHRSSQVLLRYKTAFNLILKGNLQLAKLEKFQRSGKRLKRNKNELSEKS